MDIITCKKFLVFPVFFAIEDFIICVKQIHISKNCSEKK